MAKILVLIALMFALGMNSVVVVDLTGSAGSFFSDVFTSFAGIAIGLVAASGFVRLVRGRG